jgi:CotH kinase protein
MDLAAFRARFKDRAVVIGELPVGLPRTLAEEVNRSHGLGDDVLTGKAELSALFELLRQWAGAVGDELELVGGDGRPTPVGDAVVQYDAAAVDKPGFFSEAMYLVHVTGWPHDRFKPEEAMTAPPGARLTVWRTDPHDTRHIPPPADGVLLSTASFSLMNSGNRTLRVPKRSWKIEIGADDSSHDELLGMHRFNLKAMYNDPSQMREALAWQLFGRLGLAAPQHVYAKLAFDDIYFGLFSLIEQVDKQFLRDHFGTNDKGNLYKAYCGDIGCATLERRVGDGGDDSGRQYMGTNPADLTYRLKTNEDDSRANTFDDLAQLIRVINGIGLPGGEGRFDTDAFRESVEAILNAHAFLRWAAANLLLGSWDNYFATPANYYLYNSGFAGDDENFMARPYFTFIPWDYDNSFGIDYFNTDWQDTDILDWPSNTGRYCAKGGHPDARSRIPLVQNLLRNTAFRRYYLHAIEGLLEREFTPREIDARMRGSTGAPLWPRVAQAAYLESNTPDGSPFTGRQFSNHEVYLAAEMQYELQHGEGHVEGIVHYVRMRAASAAKQLAALRAVGSTSGTGGLTFPAVMEPLPTAR